jgi:cytochrome c
MDRERLQDLQVHAAGHTTRPLVRTTGIILAVALFIVGGCDVNGKGQAPRGDAKDGRTALIEAGCGSCHRVSGIDSANGRVGPPLENLRQRSYLAGVVPNSFDNLVRWLRVPDEVVPGTAMPNMQLSVTDAENIAAYLMEN